MGVGGWIRAASVEKPAVRQHMGKNAWAQESWAWVCHWVTSRELSPLLSNGPKTSTAAKGGRDNY